ncbi:MAG: hypothetical protein ACREMK_11240 [Gemmatimonadota bacterium]
MENTFLFKWTAANALGLGVALVVFVTIQFPIKYGLDFERYWQWQEQAIENSLVSYAAMLLGLLVAGAILGASQILVLRSHGARVASWILATALGFALLTAVFWPLTATGVLGIIPGPVEPILLTVVSSSLAGICQYLALRREGIAASRWLVFWVVGLIGGIVLTAAFFISLGGAGIVLGWILDVFFGGFWVAGVAALVSGNTLVSVLSSARSAREVSRTV